MALEGRELDGRHASHLQKISGLTPAHRKKEAPGPSNNHGSGEKEIDT